jgi:hypothetical protein
MAVTIQRQDQYSRGALLLRTFFGWLYISIPHLFLLFFVSIWGAVLSFIAWWAVLFTGRYPQGFFDFQVGLLSWNTRVAASLGNLTDEYPTFGTRGTSASVKVDLAYPETLSRGILILRTLLGWLYFFIPHGVCLFFRLIAAGVVQFLAWWVVVFTGSFPEGFHSFLTGTHRWLVRFGAYAGFLTDAYPPFSGKQQNE